LSVVKCEKGIDGRPRSLRFILERDCVPWMFFVVKEIAFPHDQINETEPVALTNHVFLIEFVGSDIAGPSDPIILYHHIGVGSQDTVILLVGLTIARTYGKSKSSVTGNFPWRLLSDRLSDTRNVQLSVVVQVTPCRSHAS
jgi:hypothetical protein